MKQLLQHVNNLHLMENKTVFSIRDTLLVAYLKLTHLMSNDSFSLSICFLDTCYLSIVQVWDNIPNLCITLVTTL